ncbi:MAG: 16S rRNA (guanine(527)-N(7))-methyltransferase RsmG [Hyphomicrobiales bacterium]|nr:16S rRNA (guanine(527)-N(7))-methyltransferase RsmG [Hyphomicrobiales bacterium]
MQGRSYGPDDFARDFGVSRETLERLKLYEALLRKWQQAVNLVAPSTLDDVWRRHFADSAQVAELAPDAKKWVDLGSGAGFPGLVIAIMTANQDYREVHLVESNSKKCAFLFDVARQTGARAVVHDCRIEVATAKIGIMDVVSARAVAPLSSLLALSQSFFVRETAGLFLKGRDALVEVAEAEKQWRFQWKTSASRTDSQGQIIKIWNLESR